MVGRIGDFPAIATGGRGCQLRFKLWTMAIDVKLFLARAGSVEFVHAADFFAGEKVRQAFAGAAFFGADHERP